MGVVPGVMGGRVPRVRNSGVVPPEIAICKESFLFICQNFQIFQYFQNEVGAILGQIRIGG